MKGYLGGGWDLERIFFVTNDRQRALWELDDWWFMRDGRRIRAGTVPGIRVIEVAATSERARNVPKYYFRGDKVSRAPAWSAEALFDLAEHQPLEIKSAPRAAPGRDPIVWQRARLARNRNRG